jgi:hypothetical protein
MDLEKLAALMSSETPITMDPEVLLHTWAENPKTISTLAAIQLGIFASDKEISASPGFFRQVMKCRLVDKLVDFVLSDERDKFEAGVLALSFLTENHEEAVDRMLQQKLIGTLVRLMRDKKEGLRATAALCCRNLYLARTDVQKQFVAEGGAELLVRLLDSDDSVIVFETILNVLDLLLDKDDIIQNDIKSHLISVGIHSQLQRIMRESTRYELETIQEAEKLCQLFD